MKTIKQLSVLTSRVIKQNLTDTDTIITTFIMPIAMLLFFCLYYWWQYCY